MAALLQIFRFIFRQDKNFAFNYFIYTLLIGGLIWLSMANYWFFVEEYIKSLAAFTSSVVFFISSFIVKVWQYYFTSKQAKENILYEAIAKNQPLIDMVSKECLNFISKKGFISALSAGLIIITLYKVFSKSSSSKS